MGVYNALARLLFNAQPAYRTPQVVLWSERNGPLHRSFYDSGGREWVNIVIRAACDRCGRSEPSVWQPIVNSDGVRRCTRCVSLVYTDWES